MASNYPTSLDSFNNPSGTDSLNSPSHSLQHSDINDAVEAIEAKLGIGASPAGSATAGQVLTAQGGGTAIWETPADTSGLVHLNTTSFSAVAFESFDNVFSSTYDNYKILMQLTGSTNLLVNLRMRASGTDNSSNNYWNNRIYGQRTTVASQGDASLNSSFLQVGEYETGICTSNIDIFSPFATAETSITGLVQFRYTSFYQHSQIKSGQMSVTTSYDGFTLLASTGNITGSISIYGYRKS